MYYIVKPIKVMVNPSYCYMVLPALRKFGAMLLKTCAILKLESWPTIYWDLESHQSQLTIG